MRAADVGSYSSANIPTALAVSPDGALLAVGSSGSPFLTVYSTSTWTDISIPTPPSYYVQDVEFSSDGAYLAVAISGASPYVIVYDTTDWSVVSGVEQPAGACYSVAFMPSGA